MTDAQPEQVLQEEGKVEVAAEPTPEPKAEEPKAEEAGEACPISCSACKRGDGPFGLTCPCKHPEIFENFFNSHPVAFRRVQEVIFLKRPIVLGVTFVVMNLLFFIWRKMNLNFYAAVAIATLLYAVYNAFIANFVPKVLEMAFGANVEPGTPEQANHIRDAKEAAQFFAKYLRFMPVVLGVIEKLYKDQTLVGRLIWCSFLAGIFILSLFISVFWILVIVANIALLCPPVLTHEKVQARLNKK